MRNSIRNPAIIFVFLLLFLVGLYPGVIQAKDKLEPPALEQYQRFFAHYVDKRSITERIWNSIGFTFQDVGRSFALIAGISYYPKLPYPYSELKAAEEDLTKLVDYLKSAESFDEIVLLHNEDVTKGNLAYFLETYFPERLRKFPKSRFLFAYSGHGFTEDEQGYLVLHGARNFGDEDEENSISMETVRSSLSKVLKSAHHVLVLINACYSGSFLRIPFDGKGLMPKYPGAHAIMAGGTREKTWHDPAYGKGSVFFEFFFRGLKGDADSLPKQTTGDGIITAGELGEYLRQEVRLATGQAQNPMMGDISRRGSRGEFFFLNHQVQVAKGNMPEWSAGQAVPFSPGGEETISKTGSLVVDADPWAYIYLNDHYVDMTPYKMEYVSIREYELVLKHPDYPESRQTVIIEADQTTRIKVDLRR